MKNWILKVLIAGDYFLNAFAPASPAGMTISSHAAMARADGRTWGRVLANALDRIQKDHCNLSMIGDIGRAKAVVNELEPYVAKLSPQ